MWNLLCFTGSLFSNSDLICYVRLFLSFKSNSLSMTAVWERCVKESLSRSQDCGNSVLVKIMSYLQISKCLYWFHCHEFILQLPLCTNSKSVCCLRRVFTLLFCCPRLIQNPCIIWNGSFCDIVDKLTLSAVVTKSPL